MYKILIAILLFYQSTIFANAAQPGFWGAGGTGTFSLLYAGDSLEYKKIQMVKEKVSIQLYKRFAVVKGEYHMYNATADSITIKAGYPLNSCFTGDDKYSHLLTEIRFDSLYGIKVYRNNEEVTIISEPVTNIHNGNPNDNWYVWNNLFVPSDTTTITVYFIVNTNNAIVRKGYNKDYANGFIYLLETGATWKQPIVDGEIRIKLMDDLSIEDIQGISPDSIFIYNPKTETLLTQFNNLSPTAQNNIVIKYAEYQDDYNFQNVLNNQEQLFKNIDGFSSTQIDKNNFVSINLGDPFEVNSSGWVTSIIMFLLFAGAPILLVFGALAGITLLLIIILKRRAKISN